MSQPGANSKEEIYMNAILHEAVANPPLRLIGKDWTRKSPFPGLEDDPCAVVFLHRLIKAHGQCICEKPSRDLIGCVAKACEVSHGQIHRLISLNDRVRYKNRIRLVVGRWKMWLNLQKQHRETPLPLLLAA